LEKTFHLVALGCPKNRVDAEVIWASMASQGLVAVDDPEQADVIVINTCAFIQTAVSESLDTIVQLGRYRREGRCSLLIVAGCLTARYSDSLPGELSEVDLFVGPAEAGQLGKLVTAERIPGRISCAKHAAFLPQAATPRANSLTAGAAYMKVAEGCSRQCSFCIIPDLRGPQRSRPIQDLVEEAENLVRHGVCEIVLVAQDLAGWGNDLQGKPELADLVEALAEVAGLWWLRLMYLFPMNVPEQLVRVIADNEKVLNYLDLPFQHVDEGVLRRMRRGGDPEQFGRFVEKLRKEIPGVVLRTTWMTGFPGETHAAFERLVDFVQRHRFERLGVFTFSPEEGSEAASLEEGVLEDVARDRSDTLMRRQQEISLAYHQSLLGSFLEVLVEQEPVKGEYIGRAWNQAPEVDGQTFLTGEAEIGEVVCAKVVRADPYDLEAEIVA
jgi:ribosomal protein S12 methylthiotransferase